MSGHEVEEGGAGQIFFLDEVSTLRQKIKFLINPIATKFGSNGSICCVMLRSKGPCCS